MQMKDRNEMTYEERLEAAERHRLKGNALFAEVMLPSRGPTAVQGRAAPSWCCAHPPAVAFPSIWSLLLPLFFMRICRNDALQN
jgi:hypothetical protein